MRSQILKSTEQVQPMQWRQVGPPGTGTGAGSVAALPAYTPAALPAGSAPPADREAERQQAFAAGREQGRAEGRAEGQRQAAAQIDPLLARLLRTIEDLSATRDAFRKQAEDDVIRLALGIARRILRRELAVDPTSLAGLIRVALDKIDARELHRVRVSPEDQAAIQAGLDSLGLPRRIEVIGDRTLERGAALFETTRGTLDASLDTQLDEIERGFLELLDRRHAGGAK
jgi:flagellar assembly protein FliH